MRRLVLVLTIIAVHCLALLCARGGLSPMESTRRRGERQSSPTIQPRDKASAHVVAVASQSPPTTTPDSTYEQFIRERDAAAATQPATETGATETATAEPSNPFHLQFNLDFTNAYFYRGILQQDHGLIVQPAAKLTINLMQRDDLAIDAFLGTWNSFGRNAGTNTGDLIGEWYECDLIAGFVITKEKFSLTTSYAYLTSPSNAFQSVQELDLTLGFDDSDALGKFALHPYALLAFETGANGSDGADLDPGIYLELGIAPGFSFDLGKTPVAVSFPALIGLSISDYYQDASGADETFGYVQVGTKLSVPLPFGERFGAWTLNAGVSGLFLGDHLSALNNDDDFEVIGTIGLQWNF